MFQWAQSTFDKLSQTVAPPPEDGPGRFAYCIQRGEEDAAMGCIAGMDPVHTVVNQAKGQYPIHLACEYSSMRLVQLLMNQPGMNVGQTDLAGNTPLHYASMSTAPNGLDVVKLLITTYGASVLSKNGRGQTPYDVATKNAIRQHLLPIQLQAETQIALDNGGQGLPPGIDMGGIRISNPAMPPPPTFGGGGPTTPGQPLVQPPAGGAAAPGMPPASPAMPNVPAPHMFGTPSPSHDHQAAVSAPAPASAAPQVAPAPNSRGRSHDYSRVGSSSAAMSGVGKYRADGFHSSSSDVSLQRKYGHASTSYGRVIAPPPSSGNASVGAALAGAGGGTTPPVSGGANPFSAGSAGSRGRYGALNGRSRYVTYGNVAGPAAATSPVYGVNPMPAQAMPSNVSTFTPGGGPAANAATAPSSFGAPAPAPSVQMNAGPTSYGASAPGPSTSTPTTPYMPPPPYQSHNYAAQDSANLADVNAKDLFSAPSPQKAEPTATPEATAAVAAIASSTSSEPVSGNVMPSNETPAPEATPADDWVETVDPSSGQTYYYNKVTNETSWEKPPASANNTAAPTSVLAENWVETVDPNSGQPYYYNSVTHETSWEKPLAPVGQPSTNQGLEPAENVAASPASGALASPSAATEQSQPASAADAFGAPPPSESASAAQTTDTAHEESHVVSPMNASDAFSAPAPSATTDATPTNDPTAADAFSAPSPSATALTTPLAQQNAIEYVSSPAPAPVSASDAFSAPAPSAADAFGSPPPEETPTTFTSSTETTPGHSLHPSPAPTCAAEAFSAPAPTAASSFGVAPTSGTGASAAAEAATTSPYLAPPQRSVSADELFADEPPKALEDENDTSQNTAPDTDDFEGGDEDTSRMDDVPLSPTLQQPEGGVPAAANGELPPERNFPVPSSAESGADSLFAAIGMPPPPFSARKL